MKIFSYFLDTLWKKMDEKSNESKIITFYY